MSMIKNSTSWVLLYLVGTFFFLSASVFVLDRVLNPEFVKTALKEENAYAGIVPGVLSTAKYPTEQVGQLPLNEPWVQDAAKKAFPEEDLQQKTEGVIDATFAWLEGKTNQPEFQLDFSSNKATLGQEIGNYAEDRAKNLPRCTNAELAQFAQTGFDPYKATCVPFGYNVSNLSETVAQQVASDQGFLADPVVSSDELTQLNAQSGQSQNSKPFAGLERLQKLYQNKDLLLWLLPILTVMAAGAGYLLSEDKVKAMRRLGRSFISSAVGLAVLGVFFGIVASTLQGNLTNDAVVSNIVGPLFARLADAAQSVYFIFAGVAAIIAIALLIHARKKRA